MSVCFFFCFVLILFLFQRFSYRTHSNQLFTLDSRALKFEFFLFRWKFVITSTDDSKFLYWIFQGCVVGHCFLCIFDELLISKYHTWHLWYGDIIWCTSCVIIRNVLGFFINFLLTHNFPSFSSIFCWVINFSSFSYFLWSISTLTVGFDCMHPQIIAWLYCIILE